MDNLGDFEPLFQEEDYNQPPVPGVGIYPTLKTLGSIISGGNIDPAKIVFDEYLHEQWKKTVTSNNRADLEAALENPIPEVLDITTQTIMARNEAASKPYLENEAERQFKLEEVAKHAGESILYINNPAMIEKNLKRLSVPVDQHLDKNAKAVAGTAAIDKELEDIVAPITGVELAKGIGLEISWGAIARDPGIRAAAKEMGISEEDATWRTGNGDLAIMLRTKFKYVPDDQKAEWIKRLYNNLISQPGVSVLRAKNLVHDIMGPEELERTPISDVLDKAEPLLIFLSALYAVKVGHKLYKSKKALDSTEQALVSIGGKDILAKNEVLKAAQQTARKQQLRGVATIAGEVTGANVAVDLAKFAAMGVNKVLPKSVRLSSAEINAPFKAEVEKFIAEIKAIPRNSAFTEEEVGEAVYNVMKHFNNASDARIKNIDPARLSADGRGLDVGVTYGPAIAPRFATQEAAETALERLKLEDPESTYTVVPDTLNNSFAVSNEKIKELETKLASLTLKMADAIMDGKQLPLFPEGLTAAQVKASKGSVKTLAVKSADIEQDKLKAAVTELEDADNAYKYQLTTQGNVTVTNIKAKTDVTEFTRRLSPILGLDNKRIFVTTLKALNQTGNRSLIDLATHAKNTYGNWNGLHFPVIKADGTEQSIIILRNDIDDITITKVGGPEKITTRTETIETFAHEYFHSWYRDYSHKYSNTLKNIFMDWLREKNITVKSITTMDGRELSLSEALPFESLLEYRNLSMASQELKWAESVGWDAAQLKKASSSLNSWLADFEEFHAEMFAKWAFTDDVPKGLLGNYFGEVIAKLKQLAKQVQDYLFSKNYIVKPNYENAFKRMMSTHIESVKTRKQYAQNGNLKNVVVHDEANPSASYAVKLNAADYNETTTDLAHNIKYLEDEIEAAKASRDGVTTGWVIERKKTYALKETDIKGYSAEEINDVTKLVLGDRRLGTPESIFKGALLGTRTKSAYTNVMTNFIRKDVEKLNSKQLQRVNEAIILGDKWGEELSIEQLSGLGLTAKERNVYSKFHVVRKVALEIKRDQANASLIRRGFIQVNFKNPIGDVGYIIGKRNEAVLGDTVFDVETGKLISVNDSIKNSVDSNLYSIVTPAADEIRIGEELVDKVLVKNDAVSFDKVTNGFSERIGEYSRIYSDEYFVEIATTRNVNSKAKGIKEVHRTASTRKDAERYVEAMNTAVKEHAQGLLTYERASRLMEGFGWSPEDLIKALDEGAFGTNPVFKQRYSRTDEDFLANSLKVNSGVSQARGDRVMSVFGEDTVNTVNPLDSLAAEIGNTSTIASFQEWRETQIIRWFESFKDVLPDAVQNMTPVQAFVHMEKYPVLGSDIAKKTMAMRTHAYIKDMLEVPTKEELIMLGFARNIGEKIEGGGEGIRKPLHKVGVFMRSSSDYPRYLRTLSFMASFGLNPKHLLLQSMNAFNAVAVSPAYGLLASKRALLYGFALGTDNETIIRKLGQLDKLSNLGFTNVADFTGAVHDLKRSGLLDGINTDNLYGVHAGTYGFFNRKMRVGGKVITAPFNTGELISRIVSFDIARSEWLAANKGKMIDDNALADILLRQDDLTQNMSRANRRAIQRGTISLSTQFTGYFINMWTRVVNGGLSAVGLSKKSKKTFTPKETLSLLVAHGVAMGSAGGMLWPISSIVNEYVQNEDVSETERITLTQGALAGLIAHLSGGELKLALGSSFGTFNYYEELMQGLLNPEKSFMEVLTGPTGSVILRSMTGVKQAYDIIAGSEINLNNLMDAGRAFASNTFTAFSNAEKAYLFRNNHYRAYSKAGRYLYDLSEYENMAKALGLLIVQDVDLTNSFKTLGARKQLLQKAAKEISRLRVTAMAAWNKKDTQEFNRIVQQIGIIKNGGDWSLEELQQLDAEAYRLHPLDSKLEKNLAEIAANPRIEPEGPLVGR